MAETTLRYRLQIMAAATVLNPNPSTVALTYTSDAAGTNPYIAGPPSGDGQEIDLLTGANRAGAYLVELVDVATGTDGTGTVRAFTNQLEDAAARQQLLGRRAVLAVSSNGGAFAQLISGYIVGIRLVSPMRYAVSIGDTRRVEQTQPIFTGTALGSFTTRGCLTGGPVTTTFGPAIARGGWRYTVSSVSGARVTVRFRSGYIAGVNSALVTDWRRLRRDDVVAAIVRAPQLSFLSGLETHSFPNVLPYIGTTTANAVPMVDTDGVQRVLLLSSDFGNAGFGDLTFWWASTTHAIPSPGDTLYISLTTNDVNPLCALYLDAHPVDIVLAIWTAAYISYDSGGAWIAAIRELIGPDVRLALKLTEAPPIAQFLEEAIFGPFGITVRTNFDGTQQLVPARILTTAVPTLTIDAAAMRGAEETVFDLDERSAVSSITLTQTLLAAAVQGAQAEASDVPADGLTMQEVTQTAKWGQLSLLAARDVSYKVPGMIHSAQAWAPDFTRTLTTVAQSTLQRFGNGVQAADVAVMAGTAAAAAQVGDEVYFDAPHFPSRGYRVGESTVGARIMQVVRRTETPAGPVLRLVDSGINAQPVSPAAAITVAQSTTNPPYVAAYTITNAATINSGNVLSVAVQYAVSATTPTGNGTTHQVYAPGAVPTGAVELPPLDVAGQRVWVRARTEQVERRPSAWSAWTSVVLDAMPTPFGLTATPVSATAVDIAWGNFTYAYPIAVYAYLGGSPPSSWLPFRVGTMPAGSNSTTIRVLSAGTWQIAVAYMSPQGIGPLETTSAVTTGAGSAATRPAGLAAIDAQDDVGLPQGVALGLFASDQTLDIIVERSLSAGSGYAEVGRVNGAATTIIDQLPRDGTRYFYRLRHGLGGYDTSGPTPAISAIARGVPPTVLRPPAAVPTVQVAVSETPTTGTVSLTISDTQGRFVEARFRERTNGGAWSGWTVAVPSTITDPNGVVIGYAASYTGTLPTLGFLDIEYEVTAYGANGTLGIIAGGVESFDIGAGANMASVVGSFEPDGSFLLVLSADTDTASVRYATSTSAQPTLAATQAVTPVNLRNITQTFAGPYDVGTVFYVSVLVYDAINGGGTESGLFEYQFVRGAPNVQCLAIETTSDSTSSTVTVSALSATGTSVTGGQVQLVALDGPTVGKATIASGAAIGVWVSAPANWTFTRGAPLSGSSEATFRARRSSGAVNETDDDGFIIVEEGRDTKPIIVRVRELSTSTDADLHLRAAVNVPSPYAATSATVTYAPVGVTGITPSSPQTITTTGVGDFVTPEPAGSFQDFVVPRPLIGAPAGRVTFNATAIGFAPDVDQADVTPRQRGVTAFAKETASDNTSITATVSALDSLGVNVSGSQAQLVSIEGPVSGKATLSSGAAIGVWASTPAAWVFNRGAALSGTSQAVFRVRRSATITDDTDDDSFPITEIGIDTKPVQSRARIITTTANQCVVRVAVNVPSPYTATTATITYEPTGVGIVSPGSGQSVTTGVGDFTTPETPLSFRDFTVDRPAVGQPAGGVTFTAVATGFAPDTDPIAIPPQSTTLALLARARVTATSATSMTVRVAVASPVALSPNTASIAYVEEGVTGTSPASPRSVTPETSDTITELAGSFEDFTITRPAFNAGAGRVTFQVTATGRVAAVDAIDVPPQDKDFTPPTFSPTLTLTSTTGQVSWPAVASGVTVEGSTDNVTFTTATGTTYPTAATGRNAFGGATKFLFVRAYNAANVYTPTYSFAVPPQDPTVPTITKFTAISLTFRYDTDPDPTYQNNFQLDYTITNFPTGGSVEAVILQDGVDIGIPLANGTPSSTQGFWGSPVTLNATGSPAIRWDIFLRVFDSGGINVAATSKTVTGDTYV